MTVLEDTQQTIGEALEALRKRVFVPEFREGYKLTFAARHPENPEMDILVTEDDKAGLAALIERRCDS